MTPNVIIVPDYCNLTLWDGVLSFRPIAKTTREDNEDFKISEFLNL